MKTLLLILVFFTGNAEAATRNFIPRGTGEGYIGLSTRAWAGVYADQFWGSGAGLTSLPAGELTGTVPTGSVDLSTVTTRFLAVEASTGVNAANISAVILSTAPLANAADWDTAYSWGNHASAGYLTSYTETDPLSVKKTGDTMTGSLTIVTPGDNWERQIFFYSGSNFIGKIEAGKTLAGKSTLVYDVKTSHKWRIDGLGIGQFDADGFLIGSRGTLGAQAKLDVVGDIIASSSITADGGFYGDGSNLTGQADGFRVSTLPTATAQRLPASRLTGNWLPRYHVLPCARTSWACPRALSTRRYSPPARR